MLNFMIYECMIIVFDDGMTIYEMHSYNNMLVIVPVEVEKEV
ncbi:hypothetical protein F383_22715 [Gossypium arboreum]|uniref:Uncharacterized protein n=1 Tax=Gossypium arboreum TaxID=29729 RepID=A0A0B0MQW9_GOSAR|nr:hypothetical protein F383_22715 [Gossypium arboreum]